MIGISTPILISAGVAGTALGTTAIIFGVRKLIRMGQYSYHNSRLSTMGNPYVRRDEVLPLLGSSSPETLAKTIVSDISSGDELGSFREVDRALVESFHSSMSDLARQTPETARPLVRAYLSRLEAEELKRLLRLIGFRKDPLFPVGWLTSDLEMNLLSAGDIKASLEMLEGQPVAERLSPVIKTSDEPDLSAMDSALDMFVLDNLAGVDGLGMSARKGAGAFFDIFCDRYNIHMILRSKKAGLDREAVMSRIYGQGGIIGMPILEQMVDSSSNKEALHSLTGTHMEDFFRDVDSEDMTSIETALERMVLEGSIGLSHTFGTSVGPTIRYMISKEMELRNIRTLFQAAFAGWSDERTRRLLVLEEGA